LFIVTQVLQGLAHAHARGVIHRDLKPANILIAQDGTVKITDFGLAMFLDSPGSTAHGGVVGTPAYMSPEQISGEDLDGRSDLFSLGVTFYEMVTHRQVFGGATTAVCLNKVLNEEPPRLESLIPSFPADLQKILLRLLKKDREERYASTEKVLDDLEKFNRSSHVVPSGKAFAAYLENPQANSFILNEQPEKRKNLVKYRWLTVSVALTLILILYFALQPAVRKGAPFEEPVRQAQQISDLATAPLAADSTRILLNATTANSQKVRSKIAAEVPAKEQPTLVEDTRTDTMISTLQTGFLEIICQPWAVVYVNGDSIDLTPLNRPLELPCGTHKIILRNPAFMEYAEQVTLLPSTTYRLQATLIPKQGGIVLRVSPWAEVYIDGEYRDTTPLSQPLPISVGRHRLLLKNPAFPVWEQEVDVGAGKIIELDVKLK